MKVRRKGKSLQSSRFSVLEGHRADFRRILAYELIVFSFSFSPPLYDSKDFANSFFVC